MKFEFVQSRLQPGIILHARSYGLVSRAIRAGLTRGIRMQIPSANPVWGNHDGLLVPLSGGWYVGESVCPKARLTPISEYERRANAGECEIRLYFPGEASPILGQAAADCWLRRVYGTWYDFMAYPRLLFKNIVYDWLDTEIGWEWANWCTEGVSEAWHAPFGDYRVLGKKQATPLTVEKRAGYYGNDKITLYDVTRHCTTENSTPCA